MKGRKEEGGEGGRKGRVEVTRRAGRRGGKREKTEEVELDAWRGKLGGGSNGQLEVGGGSGRGGSARRDQFSLVYQVALGPNWCVCVDAKVPPMWGTLDPGSPGALWVPEC